MTVLCGIYESSADMVPHFIEFYAVRKVTKFIFWVYGEQKEMRSALLRYREDGLDVLAYTVDDSLDGETARKNEMRERFVKSGEWYIPADLDELHDVPGYDDYTVLQADCERECAGWARGEISDRIAPLGVIPSMIERWTPIMRQFPLTADLTRYLLLGNVSKICMARWDVPIGDGHHLPVGAFRQFSKAGIVHHFKWVGDLYGRESKKLAVHLQAKRAYYAEQVRLLDWLNSHDGKLI